MAQYIVTARKLNVRKALPDHLPDPDNIIGIVNEGYEFEGKEVESADLPNQNLGKWFRDRDGHYFWGGGLSIVSINQVDIQQDVEKDFQRYINQNFDGSVLKETIDYNRLLSLKDDFKDTRGNGITIALLDTGISPQPALNNSLLPEQFDFTNSEHRFTDIEGHGTFLAGLICGYSERKDAIIGIAPKCRIANIKVIKDNGSTVGEYLQQGLKKVSDDYLNCIVNMSLGITRSEYGKLKDTNIIDLLSESNVCIAAAGENEQLLSNGGVLMPAASDNVIAVGTIDHTFFRNNPSPDFDPCLNYILPKFNLVSYGTNSGYKMQPGVSSMACAIVSAIIALIFSKKGASKLSVKNARNELDVIATPYRDLSGLNSMQLIKP